MVATCISSLRGGNSPSSDATTILLSTAKNASEKTKQRQQTEMLDMWIARHGDNLYPCREEKERIAKELCMSYLQVNRWFANRRRKETKRRKEEASSSPRPTSSLNGRITADDTTATTTWSTREIATETAEQNPAEDAMVINAVVPDSSSIVSGAGNLMKADINQDNTIIPQVATAFQQVPELHRPIMSMSPSLIQDRQRIAATAAAQQQQQQQQVSMENGINKILTQVAAVPTPPPPVAAPQPTSLTAALSNAAAFAFSSAAAQSVNPYLLAAACSMQQNLANSLGLPTNNAPTAPQLPWNNNCVQSINAVLPYLQQLHAQAQQVALAQQLFAAQQQAAAANANVNGNGNGNGNGLVTSSHLTTTTTTTNLSPQTQLINNNNNGLTPPQHWLSPPPSATASIPDNVSSPFLLNGDESYSSLSEISELSPQPRGDIISPFTKETPSLISDEDLMIDSLIEERRDLSEKESIAVAVLAGMAACQR